VPTGNTLSTRGRRGRRGNRGRGGRGPTFQINTNNPNAGGGLTVHQSGIVDTPSGQWWSVIMQDHNSLGRVACLCPITWQEGWPLFGLPGNLRRSPATWIKPDTGHQQPPKPLLVRNDGFDAGKLLPVWQWNHHPDESKWSLSEAPGKLRLHSLPAPDFWWAKNSLTQRAIGPESTVTVELDVSGAQSGDVAGLALLNYPYAWIGVARDAERFQLQQFDQSSGETIAQPLAGDRVWLRAHCDYDTEQAEFSYSTDGETFQKFGAAFTMVF